MAGVLLQEITKSFGGTSVLEPIDVSIRDGDFCCLLGSSGSGKSTLLRIIAGLTTPDSGSIVIGDENVTTTPVEKRRIGFVFQNYALFPHLSVLSNVMFGLKSNGVKKSAAREKAREYLDLVGLAAHAAKSPAQLSGGQAQRVALARALVTAPSVLLLDEPLSALDRQIRGEMQREIKRIHSETGLTTIMVTHDQEEAVNLADQIVVLEKGAIQQQATTAQLQRSPATRFVATFLGGHHVGRGVVDTGPAGKYLTIAGKSVLPQHIPYDTATLRVGAQVDLVIIPERVLVEAEPGDAQRAVVSGISRHGPFSHLVLDLSGVKVTATTPPYLAEKLAVGDTVGVRFTEGAVHTYEYEENN
ncbi:MAG: ABC transporter ATP-binding protein [Gordonia sp. (in: high G+C Gram-positive bacteria)]